MAERVSSWAVVATVDEPPALVQAFVAWHLALGAAQVFIYLDRPDDPVLAMLAHLPKVTVVPCDMAHWLRVGKSRPRRHQVRQVRNARDAYARSQAGWLLHCDADEFVWAGRPVAEVLSRCALEADCLILPVAERMHVSDVPAQSVFEGVFRRPFLDPHKMGLRVFGPDYDLTYRGLTGHALGKAFVRKARSLQMSIHRPRAIHDDQDVRFERAPPEKLELLHLEGLTPTYWAYKLARMAHALAKRDGMPPSPHRGRQADALMAAPEQATDLYARLKIADASTQALLERHGLLAAPDFDPRAALELAFPDQPVDLRPCAVDQWVHREKGAILGFLLSG